MENALETVRSLQDELSKNSEALQSISDQQNALYQEEDAAHAAVRNEFQPRFDDLGAKSTALWEAGEQLQAAFEAALQMLTPEELAEFTAANASAAISASEGAAA